MGDSLQASILIVDDDPASRIAMREVLSTLGSRLVIADSGEQALRHVLEEDFAAILMDVRMPGIDGFTTARMIRERKRSRYTPIIFLTAAQESEVVLHVLEHVDRHGEVEALGILEQVAEAELQVASRLARAQRVGVGRDVVSGEPRPGRKTGGEAADHLARAASDLGHGRGRDAVAREDPGDMLRFPRRIVRVPVRVVPQVRSVGVDRFHRGLRCAGCSARRYQCMKSGLHPCGVRR